MRVLSSAVGVLAVVLGAAPALAHGGQYKSPAAPGPESPSPGGALARSGGDWTDWWWANRDRYIEIARRARREEIAKASSAGGLGAMAGVGVTPAPETRGEDRRSFHEREVLPAVAKALADGEAEVRSAAAVALGKMGFPRSLLDLQRALQDPHPDVRDGALLALGMLKDDLVLETLRGVLHDPTVRERTRGFAAIAIGFVGGDESARALLRFLSPASDAEREGGLQKTTDLVACAVLAAGHAGSPVATAELRRLYATSGIVPDVPRACASLSLARLGDRESIPLLLKGLRHREDALRQCAAIGLGVLGRPADGPVIAALAKTAAEDNDGGTRRFALAALGRIGGPAAREALRPFLEDVHAIGDLPFAILAVGVSGDRASAPLLRRTFREDPFSRGSAAIALGLLGDREAAPDLRGVAFGRGEAPLRAHCITALGLMGDVEAAPALRRLLGDEEEPRLRLSAAVSLAILGDPEAEPALVHLARKGGSVHVRAHSCYFLGILGTRPAALALVEAVGDPGEKMIVRMHAVAGLGVLADRSPLPLLSGLGADGNNLLPIDPLQEVGTFL
jgi:HEAT repeat protein